VDHFAVAVVPVGHRRLGTHVWDRRHDGSHVPRCIQHGLPDLHEDIQRQQPAQGRAEGPGRPTEKVHLDVRAKEQVTIGQLPAESERQAADTPLQGNSTGDN